MQTVILFMLLLGGPEIPPVMSPISFPDYRVLRPDLAVAGQPSAEMLGRLKKLGFRTLVDLSPEPHTATDEYVAMEAQGLRYAWVPITAEGLHAQDAAAVGRIIGERDRGPFLVHGATADSAGAVWAVLAKRAGQSTEQALEEGRKAGLKSPEMLEAVRGILEDPRPEPVACLDCTDHAPRVAKNVRPSYPDDARERKIEGVVELDVLIDATGRMVHATVLKSIPGLDSAAIACVRKWQFFPGVRNGRPVAARANALITFAID
jgi:TonB family protein